MPCIDDPFESGLSIVDNKLVPERKEGIEAQ